MDVKPKIKLDKVMRVYSGIDGRCMCGCSGKYTTAKQFQAAASKDRGYEVGDEECNDRTVKLMVKKIEGAEKHEVGDNYIAATIGRRIYAAYFVRAQS